MRQENYKCDATLLQCLLWNTKDTELLDLLLLNVFHQKKSKNN